MQIHRFDVVVVGAGPTGAHAAGCLAESGLKVALVDRQPQGQTGAQWINGVPEWMYKEAGLGLPHSSEIFSQDHAFTMLDPSSKHRITVRDFRLLDIDMRMLGSRLVDRVAQHKSANLFFDTAICDIELDTTGRPIKAIALRNKEQLAFEASLFVDASGLPAVIRKRVPNLHQHCSLVEREDLCTAAQEVCEISDRHGAGKFLQSHRGSPGELLAWVGVVGGYSLLRVHVEHALDRVAFLSGSRPLPQAPTGADLIRDFKAKNPWVGSRIFGGQRALPLRRPYTDLVAPGIALIGDSACQMYSSHGSGVGIGLIAAKMLADAVAQASGDIGASNTLHGYASAFHKRWGALLGTSDALRRVSQQFAPEDIRYMIASGMMTESMMQSTLMQTPVSPNLTDIPNQLIAALKHTKLSKKLSPLLWRLPLIALAPKSYPSLDPSNRKRLDGYERRMQYCVDRLSLQ